MRGLLGIAALLLVAFALSEARRAIPWRVVIGGVLLQAAIAALFLKLPASVALLAGLDHAVSAFLLSVERAPASRGSLPS